MNKLSSIKVQVNKGGERVVREYWDPKSEDLVSELQKLSLMCWGSCKKKPKYFTIELTVKGGAGVSSITNCYRLIVSYSGPVCIQLHYTQLGQLDLVSHALRPFANDHPEGPAYNKWSSGGAGRFLVVGWESPFSYVKSVSECKKSIIINHILWLTAHKKSRKAWGGINAYGQPDCKISVRFDDFSY